MLRVVAELPLGAVILAGLDRDYPPETWAEVEADPSHPQYLMAELLGSLTCCRPISGNGRRAPVPCRTLPVAAARAPACLGGPAPGLFDRCLAENALWRAPPDALAGVNRYECASPQDEAVTAALLLRRKLETPGATAALVTPDRELARRVAAEMRRWGIDIDDLAGLPLNRTPPGTFLRLVLDLAESALAPVPLLAALKHPLAAGGFPSGAIPRPREATRNRDPRAAAGAGLRRAICHAEELDWQLRRFVGRLE